MVAIFGFSVQKHIKMVGGAEKIKYFLKMGRPIMVSHIIWFMFIKSEKEPHIWKILTFLRISTWKKITYTLFFIFIRPRSQLAHCAVVSFDPRLSTLNADAFANIATEQSY